MVNALNRDAGIRGRVALTAAFVFASLGASTPVHAHHGFGLFDRTKPVEIQGTITGIDFVNPHSYLKLDIVDAAGKAIAMRCEMRAATLLRRSGWSKEMFVTGAHAKISGWGHRNDPAACYIEDITIGEAPTRNRNDQFTTQAVDTSNRPKRRPSGEPNISGDWAVEQAVLTVPPEGGNGSLVPRSLRSCRRRATARSCTSSNATRSTRKPTP